MIDTLPDIVLLENFAFCVSCPDDSLGCRMQEWQSLVQVCKRWQETIYASPRYLDLFLYLSGGDPIAENLDHWPELPLIISSSVPDKGCEGYNKHYDSLTQRDRTHRIKLFT